MKIVLIVYLVSWLILFAVYALSHLRKEFAKDNTKWYIYVAIFVLAPFATLLIPYFIIDGYLNSFKQKRVNKARKKEAQRKKAHIEDASLAYMFVSQNRDTIKATLEQIVIGRSLVALAKTGQYDYFMGCLNKLSLPKGYFLGVDMAKQTGLGDNSNLFVQGSSGPANYNYFKELTVEDSCDGAWQAYLLHSLWHILPTFWHGGYNSRKYIYSKEDLKNLRTINKEDQGVVEHLANYDLNPEVVKSPHNGKYYVTCCYWSDWGGLIRELVEICIENNKVIEVFEVQQKVEFEYDCGILF